jgi:hypothetical protein
MFVFLLSWLQIEEGLVDLNVGICEVLLQFFMPTTEGVDNGQLDTVVEYFESALYGKVLLLSRVLYTWLWRTLDIRCWASTYDVKI